MRGERGRDYKLCLAVEYFSIDGSPECALKEAFALLVIKFCVGSDLTRTELKQHPLRSIIK
jgi:hypothetical protein